MPKLFEDEDADIDIDIKTNTDYANKYNAWRKKEELYHLKQKYGDSFNNESSEEDSSSSDEEIGKVDEAFEKDFFKTLSCLKKKDPKIYNENVVFFADKETAENEGSEKKKVKKTKPLFFKDYERKIVLEKEGKYSDTDEEEVEDFGRQSPTYVEEQQRLKESFKEALEHDDDGEEKWGGLFKKRQKTKEEEEKEEEDYRKWLKGQKEQLDNQKEESELKPLKEYWNNPELNETETFLRDYLLNRRYLEEEDANHIPTYEEIIHDSDEGLSEDEKEIEKQEEFEQKYNFRYEEPDQEFIKRYPRTMNQSVRKVNDNRKVKRMELKERKLEKKKQQQEELKQLKILKRNEIEEKIKKLKEITGNDEMAFQDKDLNEDFDPEAYDKRMHELFNDDYYGGDEEDQKPAFPGLEEELGPWKDNNYEPHCEDDNFNMDCDYDSSVNKKGKLKKERKKRNRPGKSSKDDEDIFDENDKFKEFEDEYYKLDYEDMIGDIPCRFKYREVVPNSFGLTIEEILLAKERELNRWCSLKKVVQHRAEHIEKYDVVAYERKARNEELKRKIIPSLYENLEENSNEDNAENIDTHMKQESLIKNKKNISKKELDENLDQTSSDVQMKKEHRKSKLKNNIQDEEKLSLENKEEPKKQKKKQKEKQGTKDEISENSIKQVVETSKLSRRQKRNLKMKKLQKAAKDANTKEVKENRKRKHSEKEETNITPKKKPKALLGKNRVNIGDMNISNSRLEAYGINPKKFKNKMKYKNSKQ